MSGARTSLVIAAMAGALASGAAAQLRPESETLLVAIEEQKTNDLLDIVNRRGPTILNSRGYSGATPLTTALRKRANQYVGFLLQKGADPNLAERGGDTPLIIAARTGNVDGVAALLGRGALVDQANRQGETPLIIAVQNHKVHVAKKLLEAGASATRTDSASGLNARDYALRDRRSAELVRLIDSTKPKPKFIAGPVLR